MMVVVIVMRVINILIYYRVAENEQDRLIELRHPDRTEVWLVNRYPDPTVRRIFSFMPRPLSVRERI